jgi:hypothetical protein
VLPNLLIIGAAKAGTTSLWHYLDGHPEIFMAPDKELHFFDLDDNWARGVEWYAERFAGADGQPVVGEATPGYTRFPHRPYAASRAASVVPNAKLIYIVRDPIDRARSHVVHEIRHGREHQDFDQAVLANPLYVDASRYALQIKQWLEHYPRESLLIVESARMRDTQAETLAQIYAFLGVDPMFQPAPIALNESARALQSSPTSRRLRQKAGLRSVVGLMPRALRAGVKERIRQREHAQALDTQISPELRAELAARLRPDVEELVSYMPAGFTGWGLSPDPVGTVRRPEVSGGFAAFSS